MKKYLDWKNITDAMVMSDEWDAWRYDLEYELDNMKDKKIFELEKDVNFAQIYLNHAENVLRKRDIEDKSDLSLIWELRETIKDQAAWMVFMKTLRLVTIVNRAGVVPKLAQSEAEKKENKQITTDIKSRVIRAAIGNIFKKYPEMKKTLGTVWNKLDIVNKDKTFEKDVYRVKRGKDEKGKRIVIITKNNEPFCEPYKRRSLQKFINELK